MHPFQDGVRTGLERQVDVFDKLRQPRKRLDQITLESDRMWGGKTNPFQTGNRMHCFQELNKGRFAVLLRKLVPSVQVKDLPEERDFFYPFSDQRTNFFDNFLDWTAAFRPSGIGHDAESAMHVAALHDGHEARYLGGGQRMISNRVLRARFLSNVHDGEAKVIGSIESAKVLAWGCLLRKCSVHVFRDPVKLLCTHH